MNKKQTTLESRLGQYYQAVPPPPNNLISARARMLAEAAAIKAVQAQPRAQPQSRRHAMKLALAYKLIAAVMIAVFGLAAVGGGVTFAAADSVPGDTLYPVKLVVEDVRLTMASDPVKKVELNLAFANERVEEMRQLQAQGKKMPEEGISRMTRQTEQAMAQIDQVRPDDVPLLLEQVMEATAAQTQVLEAALNVAANPDQPVLRNALEITTRTRMCAAGAQGATNGNENQDQNRNRNDPESKNDPQPTTAPITPTATIVVTVTPLQSRTQEQEQNRERNQAQPTETPVVEPQQNQNTEQNRRQNQVQTTATPMPDQNTDPTPAPTATSQQNKEQEQNREQNQPTPPVATPQAEQNREQNQPALPTTTPKAEQNQNQEHNNPTPTLQAGGQGKNKN